MEQGRIDYLRIAYRGDIAYLHQWLDHYRQLAEDFCEPRKVTPAKFCNHDRFYDNSQREWVNTFEAWGIFADAVARVMPMNDRPNIMRVDWRVEVPEMNVRVSTIEHVVRANKARTRRTITRLDSPMRMKKGDRDAGGDFFAVGSKGSDRRTAVYKRGREPWAVEVQFGRAMPPKIHQEAVDLYTNTEGVNWYDTYTKVLAHHFDEAVRNHLHFSFDQISGAEKIQRQGDLLEYQENLLSNFDEFWANADPIAREVMREKVLQSPAKGSIIRYELVEPDDLWEGREPFTEAA